MNFETLENFRESQLAEKSEVNEKMEIYVGNFLNRQGKIDRRLKKSKLGYDVEIIENGKSFYYRYRNNNERVGEFAWRITETEISNKVKVETLPSKIIDVHIGYAMLALEDFDLEA